MTHSRKTHSESPPIWAGPLALSTASTAVVTWAQVWRVRRDGPSSMILIHSHWRMTDPPDGLNRYVGTTQLIPVARMSISSSTAMTMLPQPQISTASPDRNRLFRDGPWATGGLATTITAPTSTRPSWIDSRRTESRCRWPSLTWTGTSPTSTQFWDMAGLDTHGIENSSPTLAPSLPAFTSGDYGPASICTRPMASVVMKSVTDRSPLTWESTQTQAIPSPLTLPIHTLPRCTSMTSFIPWRTRESICGGWTGSKDRPARYPDWTHCGCSTTFTTSTRDAPARMAVAAR